MKTAEQYKACTEALAEYVHTAGFTEVVIGLSGGIDSSLVAAMCVDALGAEALHGVYLPGPYSSESSVADAQELALNLGISAFSVSINEAYEAFARSLSDSCKEKWYGLASENTQARCRMIVLMALSNAHNWLCMNTGNKSEAYMGYSTLYGDMCGAFAPLGGLYKTDVFALARWRNNEAVAAGKVPPIPENILVKPPSAELAPGQEDERSLGVTYAELDQILIAHVEKGMNAEELIAQGFSAASVERVLTRVKASEFKRKLEPPCPDVAFYG